MAELTLYHAAPSRSSIVRWMLEELGEPYAIHLLSLSKGEQRAPGYLAVNPMGKVPALKHGDAVITEAAAKQYFPDEDPIGKRIRLGWGRDSSETRAGGEVVGVVGDTREARLDEP